METYFEPEDSEQIIYQEFKIADGNRVRHFIVKLAKYDLPKTQNEDITDPLYIGPENSSDESIGNFELCKKNIKQYVPKHSRNDNVDRHQQQLEILRRWGQRDTENENLETRELPEKDNMKQYVAKYRILEPTKETVEKRQESVDTQQDVLIHTSNETGYCQDKLKSSVHKRIDIKCKEVRKRQELPNSIVNQAVENIKKQPLPKLKRNASKRMQKTELCKDRQYHIRFNPGVSDEHRKRILKGIQNYSWKCRENELVKDASWCKVTIENREGIYQVNGLDQKSKTVNKDGQHTDDDIVEHPAQRVKKKYQKHEHTTNEKVELSEPLQNEQTVVN